MTRKRVAISFGALAAILIVAVAGIGWYYAGEIRVGALVVSHEPDQRDLVVASIEDDQITLAANEHTDLKYGPWRNAGFYGIEWDDGYAQVGEIIELSSEHVTRELVSVTGTISEGIGVSIDGRAFDGDPTQALGLPYEDVTITSDQGDFDAWLVSGIPETWVIYTHGKGSDREESLRILGTVADLGLTSLAITYRNDEGMPPSDDGYYGYGKTEWQDLEAAVQFALNRGAEDVVLVGYSMGGAITISFMYESELASSIGGLVLDSPMLDFSETIDFGAERRGVPSAIAAIGKFAAGIMLGVDWDGLNYLDDRVETLDVPVLLFHGGADRLIHDRSSERFAAMRPDIVTYVPVDGAAHVQSWNVARDRYEQAVEGFLTATFER